MKQKVTGLQGKTGKFTITFRDFKIPPSITDGTSTQKENKGYRGPT